MHTDQLNHFRQTLGFEVRELTGGLDWWKRDGYATEGEESKVGAAVGCGC